MCSVCGCSGPEQASHNHSHEHSHDHAHNHSHQHSPQENARLIEVETDLLSKNNQYAARNRERLARSHCLAFNLVSSPGSGKTTLLTETIKRLGDTHCVSVVEGDQQTQNDAERIRQSGAKAVQINTGKGCHLDAHGVGHAFDELDLDASDYVFIENVGNLVCPAGFDLGEQAKVVVLSVTEGEDKPLKYPDMFRASRLMIINKLDLLPYVDFDLERCVDYARRINPAIEVISLSATKGDQFDQWLNWLQSQSQDSRIDDQESTPVSASP